MSETKSVPIPQQRFEPSTFKGKYQLSNHTVEQKGGVKYSANLLTYDYVAIFRDNNFIKYTLKDVNSELWHLVKIS